MGRFDGKTEKATPRKQREARKKGQIARSQEVGAAVSLVSLVLALRAFGPSIASGFRDSTAYLFANAGSPDLPTAMIGQIVPDMFSTALVPVLAVSTILALVAGLAQVGFRPVPAAGRPRLSKLNPKQGLERFKPGKAMWELGRNAAKLALLGLLLWIPMREGLENLPLGFSLDTGLSITSRKISDILLRALALAVVIAAADYAWNKYRTAREMRMSKQEVKDENKETEGDPLVKSQRRRRAAEMSRNRMLSDVSQADVVITNPTHLAIALSYADDDPAPRVIAKGADKLAAKIRGIAYRHGVPVTEDKPLARTLYKQCKVGHFVPAALYEAVAIVLAVAFRRRGRRIA